MKTPASLPETLDEEHRILGETLRELEAVLDLPPGGRAATTVELLVLLRLVLREHFAFEEHGGYLASVLRQSPHLHRTIQRLLAEHRQLAQFLDVLVVDAIGAVTRGRLDGSLRGRIQQWIADVRRHEAHENGLVQEACNRDLAAED
ncbi:MAG: hemerythrin domain-containing protein [Gemmataceae bacterium]|nr:hemerythrin domain-containing protein [Gemmataceae bacterium]